MGRRNRIWEPDVVYSAVINCVDRQFLLKPDHSSRDVLLREGSEDALSLLNDITPQPSTINIIGAAVARAQELSPIRIHWVESNINHLHIGFSAKEDQLDNISDFFRNIGSNIAGKINRKWGREGHMWGAAFRPTGCSDEPSAEQQLVYSVTNVVKDGLVETVRESPFFTSYRALAHGEEMSFWWIDWDSFNKAGGFRKRNHRPKDYLKWVELELVALPEQEEWPEHRRQSWMRFEVREVEQATRDELRGEGRRAMGVAALFAVNPRDRPKSPRDSRPQPKCHWSDPAARRRYERQQRDTRAEHRVASIEYRGGFWEREFPEGTFRPPLTKPYLSSRL